MSCAQSIRWWFIVCLLLCGREPASALAILENRDSCVVSYASVGNEKDLSLDLIQESPPKFSDGFLGFVDGPNLYAYVKQNPWTGFDPEGLFEWGKFGGHLYDNGASMVNYANDAAGLVMNGVTLGQGGYQGHADSFVNKTGAALTGLGHDIGTLNDASQHAAGGRWGNALNTAGPVLGNSPEEVAANVVTMVVTAGFGRLTKGLFRAAAVEESAAAKVANAEATAANTLPPGSGKHNHGIDKALREGAEPNSVYTQTSGDGTKAVQNTVYNSDGKSVGHVDFKDHSSKTQPAPPGHGHTFPPGSPRGGHGPGATHIDPADVPAYWSRIPKGTKPAQ